MNDDEKMGRTVCAAMKTGFVLLCVFVPLGIWKLIDLIIWLYKYLT